MLFTVIMLQSVFQQEFNPEQLPVDWFINVINNIYPLFLVRMCKLFIPSNPCNIPLIGRKEVHYHAEWKHIRKHVPVFHEHNPLSICFHDPLVICSRNGWIRTICNVNIQVLVSRKKTKRFALVIHVHNRNEKIIVVHIPLHDNGIKEIEQVFFAISIPEAHHQFKHCHLGLPPFCPSIRAQRSLHSLPVW